jgi:glycosyltransferase involved in cell wall biosynthesis
VRIGYDVTPLALNAAGERRYTGGLMHGLGRVEGVSISPLSLTTRSPAAVGQRLAYQAAVEFLYYPMLLGRQARQANVDLVHHPRALVPFELGLDVPMVVTIHDVLALSMPQYFSAVIAQRFKRLARRSARRAARVLTDSDHSRGEIVEHLGVAPERVEVIPPGVEARFRPAEPSAEWLNERFGIDRPYILSVGTLEPRKNLAGVIAAFERCNGFGGEVALVVVGGRGWKMAPIDSALRRTTTRLIATGYVEDEELVRLYAGATCFVFPSFGEGFGFPVLEAMACGTAVITSERTSIPEIAAGAAALVDPSSVEELAAAIDDVVRNAERRDELRRAGLERSRRFSWAACAERTAAVYRAALDGAL